MHALQSLMFALHVLPRKYTCYMFSSAYTQVKAVMI